MLTTLGPIPVVIIIKQIRPVIAARWIIVRPPRTQWLPASALDTATSAPAVEVVPGHRRRLSPPNWMQSGLCAQMPPKESDPLFFGIEVREAPARLIAAANQARKICSHCPVAAICLGVALATDERYGVWGGTSGRQREKLRNRMLAGAVIEDLVDAVIEDLVAEGFLTPAWPVKVAQ